MPEAKSLDVERARVAYREVSQLTCPNDQSAESKRSARLRELPSMLYNHGLGQTFAFCVAKGKKHDDYERAWKALSCWVFKFVPEAQVSPGDRQDPRAVCHWLASDEHTTTRDRRLLKEAIAYATWLKRWAEALLKGEDD